MNEHMFDDQEEDELEPYEYTPPSTIPSQAERNARGRAMCLAEIEANTPPKETR